MKYRKKPVVIEAFVTEEPMDIETLEGVMHASAGDYIITGVKGERYPCKPDIFARTYEPADAGPASPDREALLELAEEMEEFGNLPVKHPGVRVLHNDDFSRELGYARRIREALGEGES